MLGKSHVALGTTLAVVIDGSFHITGSPLLSARPSELPVLLVTKCAFYAMVAFGTLLPDIDNPYSTLGRRACWISKEIQHVAGHRTLFHSLLGLAIGLALAFGIEQLAILILQRNGFAVSARIMSASHLVLVAVALGCFTHLIADGLTEGGVPLFWPNHKRFGFPPDPHWRFRTGHWQEYAVVYGLMALVAVGIWQSVLKV
jgi:inner membrane protein